MLESLTLISFYFILVCKIELSRTMYEINIYDMSYFLIILL